MMDRVEKQGGRWRGVMRGVTLMLILGHSLSVATRASDCSGTSTGYVPLNDLGEGFFLDYQGGLYPGGKNVRPPAHELAGTELAQRLLPLDSSGQPDPGGGKIVMISVGMSNTEMEFGALLPMARADGEVNPSLILVNGAQGGAAALDWADPNGSVWGQLANRLAVAGVTGAQIQIVWIKQAEPGARGPATFPERPEYLQGLLYSIVRNLKAKYPNVVMIFLSSRIYAGYSSSNLSQEPFAYFGGFATKWLIEEQINGDPGLNFDPARGPVVAPWLTWGPYLWADGLGSDDRPGGIPGRSDGLEYQCADFQSDGTHPSEVGRNQVASLLLGFFKSDSVSRSWFLQRQGEAIFGDSFESGDYREWSEAHP